MASLPITASMLINAPANRIYEIIADYNHGHPSILPSPPFEALTVEKGGVGAGTLIRFHMRIMGKVQDFRAEISEPEPGRVLVETDLDTGAATTFTVEPQNGGGSVAVTVSTEIQTRPGFLGVIEGWVTRRLLSPSYEKELHRLALVASKGIE